MTVYLNKTPRPDILVETGGSLDENEAHVTSSTLRIYMPADSKISPPAIIFSWLRMRW